MSDYVHDRLKNRILEIVNTMISNGSIKNPSLSHFAYITHITLSRDNAYATLYVSCFEDARTERSVQALNEAAGFIQGRLARLLNTRNTPRLTFATDEALKRASRIDEILDSIKAEDSKRASNAASDMNGEDAGNAGKESDSEANRRVSGSDSVNGDMNG